MTPLYTFAMMRADSDRALRGYRARKWAREKLGARRGIVAISLIATVVLSALPVTFV
jgi:hypothetical protein